MAHLHRPLLSVIAPVDGAEHLLKPSKKLLGHGVDLMAPRVVDHRIVKCQPHIGCKIKGRRVKILLHLGFHSAEIHRLLDDLAVIMETQCNNIHRFVENPMRLVIHQLPQALTAALHHAGSHLPHRGIQHRALWISGN